MTAKQQRFIDEYPLDCNATKAAERAGYSVHTANEQAARLLAKPEIASAIQARLALLAEKAGIDNEWIRDQLKENLERSMQARPVLDEKGIPTGEYRYNGAVANKCLELLGRDLGMFGHKLEISLSPAMQAIIRDLAAIAIDCCAESNRGRFVTSLIELEMRYMKEVPNISQALEPITQQYPNHILSHMLGVAIEDLPGEQLILPDRVLIERTEALICKAKELENAE
jgi:phage terminase small subunit